MREMLKRLNPLYAKGVEYLLHPVTNARKHEEIGPIVIDRGDGIYIIDDQGNQSIEAMAGLWSVAVGTPIVKFPTAFEVPFLHN